MAAEALAWINGDFMDSCNKVYEELSLNIAATRETVVNSGSVATQYIAQVTDTFLAVAGPILGDINQCDNRGASTKDMAGQTDWRVLMYQTPVVGMLIIDTRDVEDPTGKREKGFATATLVRTPDGRMFILTSAVNCMQLDRD